jgi:hypothetical protein
MSHYPPHWYACVCEAEAEELALPRPRHRILVAVDLQLRCEDRLILSITRSPARGCERKYYNRSHTAGTCGRVALYCCAVSTAWCRVSA